MVDKLLTLGHEVIVIDNEFGENKSFYWNDLAANYQYDIRDYERIRPLFEGVDYVFHLAAISRIQPAILNPIDTVSVNSVGTSVVLQSSREAKVKRFIYSSTSAAYGHNPIPNIETQKDDCLNPYSVSKINGEKLCKMYCDLFDLKTISLRYFNVYGLRQSIHGQDASVIRIFLNQMRNGIPLTIVGDGEQRRDFIHVADIINANILVALKDVQANAFGEVYNVGSGKNYSMNQLASMISSNMRHIPPLQAETRNSLANKKK